MSELAWFMTVSVALCYTFYLGSAVQTDGGQYTRLMRCPVGLKHPHHPQISCFWDDISINASPSLLQIPAQARLGLGSPLVTPDGLASVPHQALATHPWREHNGMQPAGRRGQVQIILLIMQNGEQASQNKEGLVVQ